MRGNLLVAGGVGLIVVISLIGTGGSSDESANEKVVSRVKRDHRGDAWMKHVKDWDTGSGITVKTDYSPDRRESWQAAYDICAAVKGAYAKGANDLPKLTVDGARTRTIVKVDGSKRRETETVHLATSAEHHDFVCGIIPPKDARDLARKMGLPVYLR